MKPAHLLMFVSIAALTTPAYAQRSHERAATPVQILANANTEARQRPTPDAFDEARHVYAYQPGALYELYANPNFISTLLLEPGETVIDIAAGDTSRWTVTETVAETEREGRTIVLVKPQAANLRTNIVIVTDRRTYLIEAIAQTGEAYAAQVAWSYPQYGATEPGAAPIENLNLDYRIRTTRGRRPSWTPTRVFDDGRRTWIEFAPEVAGADMPPLFVITSEGSELVNYRVQGQRYMLDRVFEIAELRLGARAQTIVRIERASAAQRTERISRGRRP
jgi:P-type conjugative transfer protein TrbG